MGFEWQICLALLLPFLYFVYSTFFPMPRKRLRSRRPPGPPRLPFIGNLLQFDNTNQHLFLYKLSKIYGPLMSLQLGCRQAVVISSAKMAKEALQTHDLVFSSRPSMTGQQKLSYNGRDIAFSAYNRYWREMRKVCILHLLNQKRVQSFYPLLEEETFRFMKKITKFATSCQHVDINAIAMSLSSTVICRVAFGKRYDDDENGDEKERFNEIVEDTQAMLGGFFFSDYFPSLSWVDRLNGMSSRLDKTFKKLDSFFQELIEEHLDPNRAQMMMKHDMINILIQLKQDQALQFDITWDNIKAFLMDLFVAATDTIGAAIIWSMTALMKNPSELKRVQAEIREIVGKKGTVEEKDLHNLPYLKAVVKETLRLYPPSPVPAARETTDSCIIEGYKIDPKTTVYFNVWAIARDPEYWKNPNEFIPERFLCSNIDVRGHDFQVLPFGAGRRGCPGISLGLVTVELALANLLYCFDWDFPSGMKAKDIDTDVIPGLTMHKKNPVCLLPRKYDIQKLAIPSTY